MEVSEITNSPIMWIACGIGVVFIMFQAIFFMRKAYNAGPKLGLTKKQMNDAIKSGAITAVGPSFVILAGILSLMGIMGAPIVWGRLSVVGSIMFETTAAEVGSAASGIKLGVDQMTPAAFTVALWTMTLCSLGWLLFSTFAASRMDKVQKKISGGDTKVLVAMSTGALIGMFAAMSAQHIVKLNKYSLSCVLGGAFMFLFTILYEKTQKKWIKDWKLIFSIFAAMIITAVLP